MRSSRKDDRLFLMQNKVIDSNLETAEIPDWHKKLLDERLHEIEKNGFKGEDYHIVMKRIREKITNKSALKANRPSRIGMLPDIKIPDDFDKIELTEFEESEIFPKNYKP
ncbi:MULTISPECIES: hypothetical protein [unclassified Moraxella]|uniref:hypothetical protein n=1 Tax=unclassified Moraxella TaxID=2685852 RepID=UPI003AF83EB0